MSEKVVAHRLCKEDEFSHTILDWRRGKPLESIKVDAEKEGYTIELAYSESHVRALEEQCRGLAEALETMLGVFGTPVAKLKMKDSFFDEAVSCASKALAHYRSGSHE